MLGSFQCWGVLLLWHMVGQGSTVLAAGGTGGLYFFFPSGLSYLLSNVSSVARRLDILRYCGLGRYNPVIVVSYYRRRAR